MTPRAVHTWVEATATRLSQQAREAAGKSGAFALAQRSLLALASMTLISSCIVADPPTYTDPTQTRPELRAYLAKPPIYQVVSIQLPQVGIPSFTVPVRSEDNGERLLANFFLDFESTRVSPLGGQIIAPGTLNDPTDRSISFAWTTVNGASAGCHTITMVVAHESSFTTNPQTPDMDAAAKDAAIITWWVNVLASPTAPTSVVDCPSQQPVISTQ